MANILSLKRRITASRNVSKTTKAMQMIAASRLKRAQDQTLSSRPYSDKLTLLLQNIVGKLEEKYYHDYMKETKETEKDLLIVFAPDRGLCGGLIGNLISEILSFDALSPNAVYLTVGKKIEKYVSNLNKELIASFKFGTALPSFEMVYPIKSIVNDYFLNKKVKTVKILYSQFLNVFTQKQTVANLLPIKFSGALESGFISTLFEPPAQELLPSLLQHYMENTIYHNLLESFASEQGARMIAMQNATDNAVEISKEITLEYNKARQERITNEILDIGSATFSQSV